MAREHLEHRARRVVVGTDDHGRSTILSDADTPTRLATEAFTRNVIWGGAEVPTPVTADNAVTDAAEIPPPPAGYYYDISTFPPDSDWDYAGGYARALGAAGVNPDVPADEGDGGIDDPRSRPGMHQTETIDIVTVLSGEIWAVVETGETLVKAGDTVIHRGTWHAWSNRSSQPCTVTALHISITR